MGNYDFQLEMDKNDTNPIIIKQIANNSEVLELGPATGRMTQYLKENLSCMVDIVELDYDAGIEASKYARESYLGVEEGDIEKYIWWDQLKNRRYDFIIMADVLEHLSNPLLVLKKCEGLLKNDGKMLISVPNLAHNVIIANLLNDEFEYKDTGLLDRTHIHFFTYFSLKRMIAQTNLKIIEENAVFHGVEQTEFPMQFNKMQREVKKALTRHSMGNVYQFVFTLSGKGEMVRTLQIPNDFNYICKLYYIPFGEETFCEENSFMHYMDPCRNLFTFSINKSVSMIRIDPVISNCVVDIKDIRLKSDEGWRKADYVANGIFLENSGWYFSESGFQILIKEAGGFVSEVQCEMEFRDFEEIGIPLLQNEYYQKLVQIKNMDHEIRNMRCQLQAIQDMKDAVTLELDAVTLELNEVSSSLEKVQSELNAVYQSRSWRLIQGLKKILGKGRRENNG